jgi:hypothetical protein
MTLYNSARLHSFIMNKVALAQMLRYVQVPERSVEISENHRAKTTKLFILDVKPRSAAKTAEALMVTAYGVDDVELTVGAAPRLDLLRSKFDQRPGKLSIASVAQPARMALLVIGRDNPAFMPTVIAQSVRGGSDLYFMRNDLFPGEMLFGETDTSSSRKKGAASGSKQASTPKLKQLKNQSPLDAAKRPGKPAEDRPAAGPSGVKSRRRQDSSPAMSLAASDSMVSSVGGAASATPVREGGGRKKSISREPALPYARKSRVEETSPKGMARDISTSGTRTVSPKGMARDSSTSSICVVSPRDVARDNSAANSRAASPRGVVLENSAASSRAASPKDVAWDSSTSRSEASSDSEEDSDAGGQEMEEANFKFNILFRFSFLSTIRYTVHLLRYDWQFIYYETT